MSTDGGSATGGSASVGGFQGQLAMAAQDRAATWEAIADVLGVPDAARAERLRAGEHAAAWLRHCRWLGPDADFVAAPATTLEAYARASRRRALAADLAALSTDHERLVGSDGAGLAEPARAVAALCRAEAGAWTAGDVSGGRAARAQQRPVIDDQIVPQLVPVAAALVRDASGHVWRTVGRALLAVLSVETGTDHMAAAGP